MAEKKPPKWDLDTLLAALLVMARPPCGDIESIRTFQMLLYLAQVYPGYCLQTGLAATFILTPVQVTQALKRLRALGWATTTINPENERERLIGLGADGLALMRKLKLLE